MDSLWCASVLHIRLLRTLYTCLNKATHTIYISSAQHYMIKYESHVCIVQYNNTCLRMEPLTIHEPKLNTQVMGHDNTQVIGHDNTQVMGHDNTQVMGHDTCNTICGFIIVSFVFQWRRC